MSRRTQKNVGVIGLGIIGRRVADNLRRRGFHVFVWNRTPRPYPNFVGSPSELAELCDFIQIFVSDDNALLQMVEQMKPALHVQHVIMAHSTVAPHTMRNAAEVVKRRGAQFLDAPFTGSKIAAEKGELVYYVAGDDAAYKRARPVLEASSKDIIEIGEIGQATTVKIATNMVTAATVQAAAEALALVHNSGLAAEKFAAAMRGNASNSGTLTMKLPKMIEGDFDAHFSVKHMLKDVQIAARMARSYGLTLGATEAARDTLLEEADNGRADQDFSSLVRFFFPDGLPGEITAAAEAEEAQQKLNGVDDEAVAQARNEHRGSNEREPVSPAAPAAERPEARGAEIADDEKTVSAEANGGDEPVARSERENDDVADQSAADTAKAAISNPDEKPPIAAGETGAAAEKETTETATAADDAPPVADEQSEATVRNSESDAADSEAVVAEQERVTVDEAPTPAEASRETSDETQDKPPVDERETTAAEDPGVSSAAEEDANAEPAGAPSTPAESRAIEPGDYGLSGEPPVERRTNGEPQAARSEPAPERDEVAARRSFLSRMFGKGDDY